MSTRLYSQYDVLMVLIPLIDSKPWVSTNPATGLLEKYDGTKWVQYTEQLFGVNQETSSLMRLSC